MTVGFAEPEGLVVVKKRQEGVAASFRDPRYRVKQRAGKDHRTACRRTEASWSVLRKAQLTALKVGIEVDGNGKSAVRSGFCRIVAMRPEMAAFIGRITE